MLRSDTPFACGLCQQASFLQGLQCQGWRPQSDEQIFWGLRPRPYSTVCRVVTKLQEKAVIIELWLAFCQWAGLFFGHPFLLSFGAQVANYASQSRMAVFTVPQSSVVCLFFRNVFSRSDWQGFRLADGGSRGFLHAFRMLVRIFSYQGVLMQGRFV